MTTSGISPVESMDLAGEPALDFVNTGSRLLERYADQAAARSAGYGPFGDRLGSISDLVALAARCGVLDAGEAQAFDRRAKADPASVLVLERALALREALYRIFMAEIGAEDPTRADLEVLQEEAREAAAHRVLERTSGGYELVWPDTPDPGRVLWPFATDALDLLLSAERSRVKGCASEDCNWLFRDSSKNRSRRWCEMSACGNRAKARRYQQRHR